jgi:hypothetical protein
MLRGIIIFLYTTTVAVVWVDLLHGNVRWAWVVLTLGLLLIFLRVVFGTSVAEKFDRLLNLRAIWRARNYKPMPQSRSTPRL